MQTFFLVEINDSITFRHNPVNYFVRGHRFRTYWTTSRKLAKPFKSSADAISRYRKLREQFGAPHLRVVQVNGWRKITGVVIGHQLG
jgi:hypothetical protein